MSAAVLISATELADHIQDPTWLIIDCRFDLLHPEAGAAAYREAHIPGACYADLEGDLSGPITADSGRHPLPDPRQLCATFSSWGIDTETHVVCYDAQANAYAARLWWLLRWLGHERVSILNGGLQAWIADKHRLDADRPKLTPSNFQGTPNQRMLITSAELSTQLDDDRHCLIDVRTAERYAGASEPIDPVAGHIPGACNLPYQSNLGSDGRYLDAQALRELYLPLLEGRDATCCSLMCGSGVTACHSLIALEIAGLTGARLYAGSWSEWIRDPDRPVVKGT